MLAYNIHCSRRGFSTNNVLYGSTVLYFFFKRTYKNMYLTLLPLLSSVGHIAVYAIIYIKIIFPVGNQSGIQKIIIMTFVPMCVWLW